MKNVAILVPNLQSGGSERIVSRLSLAMQSKYNVFLIMFDTKDISYEHGGTLIDMNLPPVKGTVGKLLNMRRRINALKKIVKNQKIDIICSFTATADYVNAFSKADCKRLISCREATFMEKHLKRYKAMCKRSDGILFNAEGMREIYLNHYPKDASKTFMLYNLFDIEKINEKLQDALPEEYKTFFETHKVITTVSRFAKTKGQWHLIKSFEILKEKVPDAGLLFVGHCGALEQDIHKMAAKSKYAEDIKFTGFSDNPFKFVSKSDVYALCSLGEGFPNALVEAMASGAPAVATNCKTGPYEILFEKYKKGFDCEDYVIADYGIITPRFDDIVDFDLNNKSKRHKIYAGALERILTDKQLAIDLAEKGKKRAESYDQKLIINKYIKLLENSSNK
ncbi:MAG: glycosyltransferase [Bacillota bacterium]|nr:glycosyltransferase [Bacillota bacterium]